MKFNQEERLPHRQNDMAAEKDQQNPGESNCVTHLIQEHLEESIKSKEELLFMQRASLSPAEFSKICGRSRVWGYRRIYDGTVKVISVAGRIMIPITEIKKLISGAEPYSGNLSRIKRFHHLNANKCKSNSVNENLNFCTEG